MEERRRLREELSEFVESCWRTLEEVTTSLGWTLDRLVPGEEEAAAEVRRGVLSGALGGRRARVFLAAGASGPVGSAGGPPDPGTFAPSSPGGAPPRSLALEKPRNRCGCGVDGGAGAELENKGAGTAVVRFVVCRRPRSCTRWAVGRA